MEYVVHFLVAMTVSTITSSGGGGGGLIMTPYLLLVGYSPIIAVGSGKVAAIGMATGATKVFHKAKQIDWQLSIRLMLVSLVAGLLGASLVFEINDEHLTRIVGISVLLVSTMLIYFFIKGMGLEVKRTPKIHRAAGYTLYGLNSTAQAGIGSGLGMFNSIILIGLFGQTAIQAVATKRLVNFVALISAAAIFIYNDGVNWALATALFVAYLIGSYIGSHIALKKGNRFVMGFQATFGFVMAMALILR